MNDFGFLAKKKLCHLVAYTFSLPSATSLILPQRLRQRLHTTLVTAQTIKVAKVKQPKMPRQSTFSCSEVLLSETQQKNKVNDTANQCFIETLFVSQKDSAQFKIVCHMFFFNNHSDLYVMRRQTECRFVRLLFKFDVSQAVLSKNTMGYCEEEQTNGEHTNTEKERELCRSINRRVCGFGQRDIVNTNTNACRN